MIHSSENEGSFRTVTSLTTQHDHGMMLKLLTIDIYLLNCHMSENDSVEHHSHATTPQRIDSYLEIHPSCLLAKNFYFGGPFV